MSKLRLPVPAAFSEIEVALPLAPLEEVGEYASRNLCIRQLSIAQAHALRRLELGLDAVGARCAMPGGAQRRVICRADAIRWLLDRIAEAGA